MLVNNLCFYELSASKKDAIFERVLKYKKSNNEVL